MEMFPFQNTDSDNPITVDLFSLLLSVLKAGLEAQNIDGSAFAVESILCIVNYRDAH